MKKRIFYFLFLCLYSFSSFAQLSRLDSLKRQLATAPDDTNKIVLYLKVCMLADSLPCGEEALKLAKKLDSKEGIAISVMTIGDFHYRKQQYDKALEYYAKATKLCEAGGFKDYLARLYMHIGYIYRPNEPNIALEYYEKSLQVVNELKDELSASYMLSAIGNVYEGTYGTKTYNGHNALEYYEKSLEIRERLGSPEEIAASLNETSRIYEQSGNVEKAASFWQKGLSIAEKIGSGNNIVYFCNLIGQSHYRKGDYSKALEYQQKAYKVVSANKVIDYTIMSEVAYALALTYSKQEDYKKATEYYELYNACNDTLRARTDNVSLVNLKHTLATEREQEHLLLKDAEIEKQKAIVETQIVLRNAFLIGLGLVIALVVFILRGYRQKQKANQKLEGAYKIIEEKTKAITDSIRYALRIQRASLPHRSEIWAALQQSFVLYIPKDIVSGDFYWFNKSSSTVFLAAVDCTGHGVPGAFMSIVGSERLNDAAEVENDPGKMLALLNKGIKRSLRQSEHAESTRDGMDIALCSIDLDNYRLSYAGANRPLWIIRKDSNTIEEIKATKMAIGGLTRDDQSFDTHTVQLQKGDNFYIFTDGYMDQFGGPEGKKMTTKRFKEILLSIQDRTMQDQRKYLTTFAESWKGNLEQVDDILVMGVKL